MVPARSGSPGKPIRYAAAAGSSVIIDGQGITLDDDLTGLFLISGRHHLIVRGFRVINVGPHRDNAGILVDRSSDIVLSECSTADTASSGIGVWASRRITIQGCRVERAGSGGWQESITVAGTEGFEVRSCTVRDCRKEGICLKDGSSRGTVHGNEVSGAFSVGIYVDAWNKPTRDIEVYANLVHDNAGTGIALASEMGGRLERIWIHDNVSFRNRWLGIQISTNGDSPRHPMRGITVINNTCAGNGGEDWGGGIALDNPDAADVLVRNNICSANRYFQLLAAAGAARENATIDHNLVNEFRGTEDEILGGSPAQGDPLFVDPARGDFHLRRGSPAIGAGSAEQAPPFDFDGHPRGGGRGASACDIGAFQG